MRKFSYILILILVSSLFSQFRMYSDYDRWQKVVDRIPKAGLKLLINPALQMGTVTSVNNRSLNLQLGANIYDESSQSMTMGKLYRLYFDSDAENGSVSLSNATISDTNIYLGSNLKYLHTNSSSGVWSWSTTANITNIDFREVLNAVKPSNFVEDFSKGGARYGVDLIGLRGDQNDPSFWSASWHATTPIPEDEGFKFTDDGTNSIALRSFSPYLFEDIENGAIYRLSGFIKNINAITGGFIRAKDEDNNIILTTSETVAFQEWTYVESYCRIPAATERVRIMLFISTDGTGTQYVAFRDIKFEKVVNGNHGIMMNNLEDDQPAHPAAFKYNGIDQYVDFGDVCDVGLNPFILFAWIKTDATTPTALRNIFDKRDKALASGGKGYSLTQENQFDRLGFGMGDGTNFVPTYSDFSTFPINDNEWHFVAIVCDRKNAIGYIDGVKGLTVDVSSIGDISTTGNLVIGRQSFGTDEYWEDFVGLSGIYIFDGQDGAPNDLTESMEKWLIKEIYNITDGLYLQE